jgi:GWxTD domain-containing protein
MLHRAGFARRGLLAASTFPLIIGLLPWASPAAVERDTFPIDRSAAIATYEADPNTWADGPVQYLMLPDEVETWKDLATVDDRRNFMKWFWDRRDDDLRDNVNPTRDAFYQRVAEANRRFAGVFPKGWKSDPGRVWVILGRPDNIHNDGLVVTVWTYFTRGRQRAFTNAYGEMQLAFIESAPGQKEIVGDLGVGQFPFELQQAFDYTREAMIINPDLEFHATSH